MTVVLEFGFALVVILGAAVLFTNAVEILGGRLKLGRTIARDVGFFLVFFAVAAGAGILELPLYMRVGLVALLIAAYAYYVGRTLHSGGALEELPESLVLWRFGSQVPTWAVVAQALATRMSCGVARLAAEARTSATNAPEASAL